MDIESLKTRMDNHVSILNSYFEAFNEVIEELKVLTGQDVKVNNNEITMIYKNMVIVANIESERIIKQMAVNTQKNVIKEDIYNLISKSLIV